MTVVDIKIKRSSEDGFALVKSSVPLKTVLAHYGAQKSGRFWNPAPCCGHHDCLWIDDDKGLYNCASCNNGGSVIDLVMITDGLDMIGALKKAAEIGGVALPAASKPKSERILTTKEKIFIEAANYYHQQALKSASPARDYFIKRRGHAEETFAHMSVGYADGNLLAHLKSKGFTEKEVMDHGLAAERKGATVDYFWEGLVVFPVYSADDRVLTFTCKDPSGKHKGLMVRGVQKDWFLNHRALEKHNEIIIVEGENDVASLFDIGYKNVIGVAGGVGEAQLRILKNHCKKDRRFYLWFDADLEHDPKKDDGGPRFTRLISKTITQTGGIVKIIVHSGAWKDPDEYIQSQIKTLGKAE